MVGSLVGWYVACVALPLAIARRTRRLGWSRGHPGRFNRFGLVPVGLGSAGLIWCMIAHYPPSQTVEVSLTPEYLVRAGPYQFSRNPMYLCEQSMWLGWSVFFGSPALLGSGLAIAAAMQYAVSREETTLRDRFGQSWVDYANTVPRWFGRRLAEPPVTS